MNLFELRNAYRAGTIEKQQFIDDMHQLHDCLFDYSKFIRDTDIASIEITAGRVVMTSRSPRIKVVCDPASKRIAPIEILNFGSYEREDSNMMMRLVEEGFTVFDVGANVGWYSLNFATLSGRIQVHAFEPIPATYDCLKANIELNGANNVHPHNMGLGDRPGEATFYYHPQRPDSASTVNLLEKSDAQKVTCRIDTLDQFAAETGTSVDFLKIDVEGAELLVLKGAMGTISRYRPIIFAEMLRKWSARFGYHPNDIITLLAGAGYRCFTSDGDRLEPFIRMDESTLATNFFFLHSDKHASKIRDLVAASGRPAAS